MNPKTYKTVGDRHRILTALEKVWERYPSDTLTELVGRFTETKAIRDENLLRKINEKIR